MIAVISPIILRAMKKHSHPPQIIGGGIKATIIFQGKAITCKIQSRNVALTVSPEFTLVASTIYKNMEIIC